MTWLKKQILMLRLSTGIATNSALTAIENKIPDVSSLVKKNRL